MAARACAVLALSLALASCSGPTRARTTRLPHGGPAARATVVEVIDGDTVDLRVGGAVERARLLGIDTPETVKPDNPVECYGPEASARAKVLLPHGAEVLVRDQEARDRYGRLLVYLWRAQDHLFVNLAMVTDGYARTLAFEPNTSHRSALSGAEAAGAPRGAGLWGGCPAAP